MELTRPAFEKFSATMVARKYPSVRLHSKILENTGHGGTKNETYARRLPDGRPLQLKNENGQLALYFASNRIFTLYAASEKDFYATAEFLNIHFENASGKPPGFWLETYPGSGSLPRMAVNYRKTGFTIALQKRGLIYEFPHSR